MHHTGAEDRPLVLMRTKIHLFSSTVWTDSYCNKCLFSGFHPCEFKLLRANFLLRFSSDRAALVLATTQRKNSCQCFPLCVSSYSSFLPSSLLPSSLSPSLPRLSFMVHSPLHCFVCGCVTKSRCSALSTPQAQPPAQKNALKNTAQKTASNFELENWCTKCSKLFY